MLWCRNLRLPFVFIPNRRRTSRADGRRRHERTEVAVRRSRSGGRRRRRQGRAEGSTPRPRSRSSNSSKASGSRRARRACLASEFELTGNGTVLLERFSNTALPGNGRMATAYHLDGADLVLTHYCMANNQPVLRAERFDAAAKEIQFEFVRAGNLATPNAGHMRRAKYRLVDAGPLRHRVGVLRKRQEEVHRNRNLHTRQEVETDAQVHAAAARQP